MRTRAKKKFVAKATALGARVPRAELFVLQADARGKRYSGKAGKETMERGETA